jgi:hypothetical protein
MVREGTYQYSSIVYIYILFLFRLLNLDVGHWCHLNCALWSAEVYETVSGALMCVEQAHKRSINTECASCKQKGASLTCFSPRCPNTYHFPCAVNGGCVFYKNKVRLKSFSDIYYVIFCF